MNFGSQTGMTMLLKSVAPALGIDGHVIMQRAQELEKFARAMGISLERKVSSIDSNIASLKSENEYLRNQMERLTQIVLVAVTNMDASKSGVVPAGMTFETPEVL